MLIDLDTLFPPTPNGETHRHATKRPTGVAEHPEQRNKNGRTPQKGVSTRWAAIYTLELRGLNQHEIAEALNLSSQAVWRIVNDKRYITYREEHLTALDAEFVMMKPLAFNALKAGLNSADENTALRASEQWFKGAGFGGFAKDPTPPTRTTAEDVAAALIAGVQVNVNVNVGSDD